MAKKKKLTRRIEKECQIPLRDIPKGDFFRKKNTKKVWIKGDYDRSQKKYECQAFDDISNFAYLNGDKIVEAGFDF